MWDFQSTERYVFKTNLYNYGAGYETKYNQHIQDQRESHVEQESSLLSLDPVSNTLL